MLKETSIGGIVFYQAKEIEFLILQYSKNYWGYVKGKVESREKELDTLKRELKEETSIKDYKIIPNFRSTIKFSFYRNNNKINKQVHLYIVQSYTKKIKLSKEHLNYKWLPYNEAYNQVTFNNAKNILNKANKLLKNEKF